MKLLVNYIGVKLSFQNLVFIDDLVYSNEFKIVKSAVFQFDSLKKLFGSFESMLKEIKLKFLIFKIILN